MPLSEMSPNIREAENASRKRSHDEFTGDVIKPAQSDVKSLPPALMLSTENCIVDDDTDSNLSSPPMSPTLTEAGSSTPTRVSSCPLTPTKASPNPLSVKAQNSPSHNSTTKGTTMANPPAKRKRLTAAEKEAREKEILEKKKEKEEKASAKAAEKAAEKAKQEEEKAARLKEREEKRKKKEEEDKAKAEQRDEKRRKKEEEQQRLQDEKDKKARQQKTLNSFFKAPGTPKKPVDVASKIESPSKEPTPSAAPKPTITPYQKLFKPFFVKDSMRMASSSRMDEATKEAKSKALDTYLVGTSQQSNSVVPFKPRELFGSSATDIKRGRQHYPVKHIMEMIYKQTAGSGNAGTDETNNIIKQAKAKLATVPVKIISFSQDVRPPYYGTITYHPFALGRQHMRSLARKSVNRVLPLDYDFDSEAEWQEEDGEDVDMDDDEEELDEEDDMDGFLDDSEDAGLTRRIFANNIEPETTGICFEDTDRVGPASAAYAHRMEFMHERIENNASIDPWATAYWEVEVAKAKAPKAAQSSDKASKMPPPPTPTNAFEALTNTTSAGTAPAGKLVKAELMDELKQTVLDNKALSKMGIIDFVFHKLKGKATRTEVTNTIAHVAERTGAGRAKEWSLKEGHELDS